MRCIWWLSKHHLTIIERLFDVYRIIIWRSLNVYLMFITSLFDDHWMIIWCLFAVYLMIILRLLKFGKVDTRLGEPVLEQSQTGRQVLVTLRGPESKIWFVANHPQFSIDNPNLMILSLSVRLSADTPDNQRIMNG